jgi:peptide/nickel transport system substrate-binding protein
MAVGGGGDYLPIRGVSGCSPRRCGLSKGIESDAVARTVTIHLTKPDPEFLHKVANALVVPASSPIGSPRTPLPGTGPYTIKRWDAKRGGLLVRNPHFRVLSPDRPDGFPDEITLRRMRPERQLAALERGSADVAVGYFGLEYAGPARTRLGTRVHYDSSPQTWFLFLNARVPPFDDPRVRRAINYAIDRDRVAEILGSRETHKPTCQLLPPGFRGYTPSCPFSVASSAAGAWIAPDLAKARALIAASGTRGMKVQFWGSRPWEGVGDYVGTLLRRLGYRSSVRTFDDLGLIMERSTGRSPQIGLWGWIADSAGPLNFLTPLVLCDATANLSRFCSRGIDAAAKDAALARGDAAVEQWRDVEAELAKQSPTVPLVNQNSVSLTGARVDNYQYHQFWGPLLDQMWVE